MALPILMVFFLSALTFVSYALVQSLRRNIASAQATGLRYVIVPFYIASVPWLLLQPIFLPLLDHLPERLTKGWLPYAPRFPLWLPRQS